MSHRSSAVRVAFAALIAGAVGSGCAPPDPIVAECASAEVRSKLVSMVREQFLWTVLADTTVPIDDDRRGRFAHEVSIAVAAASLNGRDEATGKLECVARIVFEAPRLDGGLNKRANGEIVYGVWRGANGSFLVDVPY